jgi:FAD/FMN-containing dehydrogenase
MVTVTSWGRLSLENHSLVALDASKGLVAQIQGAKPGIAFGMGRSYGDICLNPGGIVWSTSGLDRFIAFDAQTGDLTCEAGVLLRDIQRLFIPQGWILPVTPGTQMVTVGGAIANDIHGKNHHRFGSFGDHVQIIELARTDGTFISCGPSIEPQWFAATVGGLGLTGLITQATIRLKPVAGPWLDTETIPYQSLEEFFKLADGSEADWEHTVSWIDCLAGSNGRGIFMRATPSLQTAKLPNRKKALKMALVPPVSLVNKLTLKPFNTLYFELNRKRAGKRLVHYEPFFYPLDNILEWNRMYGPKGFYQYQSVVPREVGQDATAEMLRAIKQSGTGSFLAVLKTFGQRESVGMMSFPMPGVTLALDFPNQDAVTEKLFARLDAIVREARGRIYLAKDARMPRDIFEAGYPLFEEFKAYRDPGISSQMSRRLLGS